MALENLFVCLLLFCLPSSFGLRSLRRQNGACKSLLSMQTEALLIKTGANYGLSVLHSPSTRTSKQLPKKEGLFTNFLKSLNLDTLNTGRQSGGNEKPPLLFIHGSLHSANCWSEEYMQFFSSLGYDCYAVALRGTAASGMAPDDPKKTVPIDLHVQDLTYVLQYIATNGQSTGFLSSRENECPSDLRKPVIISHSFGGLITMKLLEISSMRSIIRGASFLSSVPPSGNGPMTLRFLRRDFGRALRIVYGFVFKAVCTNKQVCKDLFFDEHSVSDDQLDEYMARFKEDSVNTIDIASLSKVLPSKTCMDEEGVAAYLSTMNDSSGAHENIAFQVIGAAKDYIVDAEGVEETAVYFKVNAILIDDLYHDVMLGTKHTLARDEIASFLQSLSSQ